MITLEPAHFRRLVTGAEGAVTPEYVVGTVAAVSFGVTLAKFLTSPFAHSGLFRLLLRALGMT
jgi:hypothetical protein